MTYTPGPWEVDPKAQCRIREIQNLDTVATTGCDGSHRDEWEANARLIAAAPDLLAALKDLIADVENVDSEANDWSQQVCVMNARAAIARAEGRS